MSEVNTINKYLIGVRGDQLIVGRSIVGWLSKHDALIAAAYLVSLAEMLEPADLTFEAVLNAVQGT